MSYPKPLRRLIVLLAKLPGVGEKTATRLALHMLKMTPESVRELGESIAAIPNAVIHCSRCFNIADQDPCAICADPSRHGDLLCVVENPTDLVPIEKSGEYRGRYYVLGGAISPIDGMMPEDLRVRELMGGLSGGGGGPRRLPCRRQQATEYSRHPDRLRNARGVGSRIHRRNHRGQGDQRAKGRVDRAPVVRSPIEKVDRHQGGMVRHGVFFPGTGFMQG